MFQISIIDFKPQGNTIKREHFYDFTPIHLYENPIPSIVILFLFRYFLYNTLVIPDVDNNHYLLFLILISGSYFLQLYQKIKSFHNYIKNQIISQLYQKSNHFTIISKIKSFHNYIKNQIISQLYQKSNHFTIISKIKSFHNYIKNQIISQLYQKSNHFTIISKIKSFHNYIKNQIISQLYQKYL